MLYYLLHGLLWLVVAMILFVAAERAHTQRAARRVGGLQIEIADSTSHGQLVTHEMVKGWLSASKINLKPGAALQIDLDEVERLIARNGFVGEVAASIGYNGELLIEIHQREPLFRLLIDGYNHYVTEQGYIFRAPHRSSICVPVVTGSYRLPFDAAYEGELAAHREAAREASERRLEELEREKYPIYTYEREQIEQYREIRRTYIKQGLLESDDHFEKRVDELRAEKRRALRHFRYAQQQVNNGIERVDQKQLSERERQKKLEKNYEDVENLITFVKKIEQDAYWRSEVVQIVASQAHSGALEVALIPRSGAFTIRLGRLEECDRKLELVEEFCHRGLSRLGWDRFKTINFSCRGQVICTER